MRYELHRSFTQPFLSLNRNVKHTSWKITWECIIRYDFFIKFRRLKAEWNPNIIHSISMESNPLNSETRLERPPLERPPYLERTFSNLLKFLSITAFHANWTCLERPPVWKDHLSLTSRVVVPDRFDYRLFYLSLFGFMLNTLRHTSTARV